MSSQRTVFKTYEFALIIVRHPGTGKFLAVNETRDRGWWIPGGAVDAGETFSMAAHRETKEEAGIDIEIMGVLRVEHGLMGGDSARMRVIFYAEPRDLGQVPKQKPDSESLEARWVTLKEFQKLGKIRGNELLEWGTYIEAGGQIFPVGVLQDEGKKLSSPLLNKAFTVQKPVLEEEAKREEAASAKAQNDSILENTLTNAQRLLNYLMSEHLDLSKAAENIEKFISSNPGARKWLNKSASRGLTPLYKALREGLSPVLITPLLEGGADPLKLKGNLRNAFHYAAKAKVPENIVILIDHIADSGYSKEEMLAHLKQKETEQGMTALEMARAAGDEESAELIKDYMVRLGWSE